MKILRVINTIASSSGGPIEGLKQASRIMSEIGVEVEVACIDQETAIAEELKSFPWKVYPLGPGKFGNYSYSPKMRDWMQHNVSQYDAVIIHGNWQYHGLATAKACLSKGVPYFIYPHGMLDPWFNKQYPLKRIKKRLYWNGGEHFVLKHAKAVLFTCTEECLRARECFKPYQVTEKVIGYGTNAPAEALSSLQEKRLHQAPYFLFLGRIQEKKGLDLLIQAYAELRSQREGMPDLVIAGPVQQLDYAEMLKTRFPKEGIFWFDSVKGIKKWQLLAGAEALVLPSHQENFGIVVAEALAVGTPTLISNKVNIFREIKEGGAGLVENDDSTGTCQLLNNWLSLSIKQKDTMSEAAHHTFLQHFEIRAATESLVQFIRESI